MAKGSVAEVPEADAAVEREVRGSGKAVPEVVMGLAAVGLAVEDSAVVGEAAD